SFNVYLDNSQPLKEYIHIDSTLLSFGYETIKESSAEWNNVSNTKSESQVLSSNLKTISTLTIEPIGSFVNGQLSWGEPCFINYWDSVGISSWYSSIDSNTIRIKGLDANYTYSIKIYGKGNHWPTSDATVYKIQNNVDFIHTSNDAQKIVSFDNLSIDSDVIDIHMFMAISDRFVPPLLEWFVPGISVQTVPLIKMMAKKENE
ncbi:MAG: hypothetical protein PF484_03050, partial [Bacteroidales bacterium]|nr:hypothetical protein [Bacteroidales bacterium]